MSWWQRAACLGRAPLFDETVGDEAYSESRAERQDRFRKAKGICAGCPVSLECLAEAQVGRDEGVRAQHRLPPLNNSGRWKETSEVG